MTISKRDAKLLLVLLGIVILLVSYLAVYSPYATQTEELESEISALRPQLQELQGYNDNLAAYQAGIQDFSAQMTDEVSHYPSAIRTEDLILYALELRDRTGMDISGISFTDPEEMTALQILGGDGAFKDATAYRTTMTLSCTLDYDGLKTLADYVASTGDRTALDAVSVSYNAESGALIGSATVDKYYITAGDEDYVPTQVPDVPLGTDDIFGTVTVLPAETETAAQGD